MDIPQLVYSFTCRFIFEFLIFGCYKSGYHGYSYKGVFIDICFHFSLIKNIGVEQPVYMIWNCPGIPPKVGENSTFSTSLVTLVTVSHLDISHSNRYVVVSCLEKTMATYSSTLAWKIPWTEEPGRLQSMALRRIRQWQPTLVLLPGKSHGQRSLVGCSPWRCEESDSTEWLHFHFSALEKEMATHSSVLPWRLPGMAEPGGLPSVGSHRVGYNWSDLAAAAASCFEFTRS